LKKIWPWPLRQRSLIANVGQDGHKLRRADLKPKPVPEKSTDFSDKNRLFLISNMLERD
jgi:hypothetical protein